MYLHGRSCTFDIDPPARGRETPRRGRGSRAKTKAAFRVEQMFYDLILLEPVFCW